MKKSLTVESIVLKRKNLGETDRVVTLICQEMGKITCIAKGVRKLNSSFSSIIEPGNLIRAYLIKTKSMPLLVQARLIEDASATRSSLPKIRRLSQILEIFDKLLVEEELPQETFLLIKEIRQLLIDGDINLIRSRIKLLIKQLGFADNTSQKHQTMLEYIQEVVERPMQSFKFLQTDTTSLPTNKSIK